MPSCRRLRGNKQGQKEKTREERRGEGGDEPFGLIGNEETRVSGGSR